MLSPENSKTPRVKCKLQDVVNTHDACGMTAFKECAKETIRQRLFSLWPVSCNQKQVEGLQVAICKWPSAIHLLQCVASPCGLGVQSRTICVLQNHN